MSIPSWVRVGAKCVYAGGHLRIGGYGDEYLPVPKTTYTVRETVMDGDLLCIRVNEIVNPMRTYTFGGIPYIAEAAFSASKFRPLISEADDVAMFKSLLRPADPIELCEAFESNLTDIEAAMERAWKR